MPNCEEVSPDGLGRMKGVVLDGTATGILGKTSLFRAACLNIRPSKNCSNLQYIVPNPTLRKFLGILFKSSVKSPEEVEFGLKLPKSISKDREWITKVLFHECDENEPYYVTARFLRCCFSISSEIADNIGNIRGDMSLSDDQEERKKRGKDKNDVHDIRLCHMLSTTDLRIAAADFGLCYATTSIPGAILAKVIQSQHLIN